MAAKHDPEAAAVRLFHILFLEMAILTTLSGKPRQFSYLDIPDEQTTT